MRGHLSDRGNARIDKHDFLARRGIGVKLFMAPVKAILDLVDERCRAPLDVVERDVDFENLLAVPHLGRSFDADVAAKPGPKPTRRLLLELSEYFARLSR